MIVHLRVAVENNADTVCDFGLENINVTRFMLATRGLNQGSIMTWKSVHNQRIQHLRRDVNRIIVSRFSNIFLYLEHVQHLDVDDEKDLYTVHLTQPHT